MRNKKRWFMILILFSLIFISINISLLSPEWVGYSDDGKWKAILYKDKQLKTNSYFGKFKWMGSSNELKQIKVTFTQYRVNGKYRAGDPDVKKSASHSNINDLSFVGFTSRPGNKDRLVAIIHWTNGIHSYQDAIVLKMEKKSIWSELSNLFNKF
ncbi:MAG TPA: DUF4944 domain-containing protein [Bacillales bacterium]|nr:DUF4944 domain-containing protein [Bacillales bacterium]